MVPGDQDCTDESSLRQDKEFRSIEFEWTKSILKLFLIIWVLLKVYILILKSDRGNQWKLEGKHRV